MEVLRDVRLVALPEVLDGDRRRAHVSPGERVSGEASTRSRRWAGLCAAAAVSVLLTGCCALDVAPAEALADAVEQEHMDLVNSSPSFDDAQKQRRARAWEAFRQWIAAVKRER
jgi:hypothetical protein